MSASLFQFFDARSFQAIFLIGRPQRILFINLSPKKGCLVNLTVSVPRFTFISGNCHHRKATSYPFHSKGLRVFHPVPRGRLLEVCNVHAGSAYNLSGCQHCQKSIYDFPVQRQSTILVYMTLILTHMPLWEGASNWFVHGEMNFLHFRAF